MYTRKKIIFVKMLIYPTILLIVIGGFSPNISGNINQLCNLKIENNILSSSLPRWREEGTPYNPKQSLQPYAIHPSSAPRSVFIESPPEYGPVRGVIFCYISYQLSTVVCDLVVALTQNDQYDEIAYVVVSNTSEMDSAINLFTVEGANMSKVEFIIEPVNAIWIRDYGPHFIWQNGTLGIVDSHYFWERPLDNFIPTLIGDDHFLMPTYDMGLEYSGGNFQPGPNRTGFITSLILLDNPSTGGFNETFIAELYQTYQGIDELHIMPQLPPIVDGTGHIDMWMNIVDEDTVIISEFKSGSNPEAIEITNNAVHYMEDLGFEVYRTPAWNVGLTHYTYTNAFRVNDRIFIPSYGNGNPDFTDEDVDAIAAWTAAAGPNVTIIPIDCYDIIPAAGAIHCIIMQVPRYTAPTPAVNLISPTGGEFLVSGTTHTIEWSATDTDNVAFLQIDLYYSIDDGDTYKFIDSTTDTGFYYWEVPVIDTDQAKIKVVAISEDFDQAVAESAEVFTIAAVDQAIYDFNFGAGIDKFCFRSRTLNWDQIDGKRTPAEREIGSLRYRQMAKSDASGGNFDLHRYISPNPLGKYESTHVFEFIINEDPEDIEDIEICWEGYADYCIQVELYIWDYIKEQWSDGEGKYNQNRYLDNWAGNRDGYLNKHIRSNFTHFINSEGIITLLLYVEGNQIRSFNDYFSITISPGQPIKYHSEFLIGLISNINRSEVVTSFNAKAVMSLSFNPFEINFYNSDGTIFISNENLGFVGQRFIIGLFKIVESIENLK